MSGEPHEGVLTFSDLQLGRVQVLMGVVQVAEIVRSNSVSMHGAYYRIMLPDAGRTSYRPTSSFEKAKELVIRDIGQWLEAARLQPMGAS